MSKEWMSLDSTKKSTYEKQCENDKERYSKEMAIFNANKKKEEPKKAEAKKETKEAPKKTEAAPKPKEAAKEKGS